MTMEKQESLEHKTTRIGLILSIVCAIHCMVTPLLMISFPFLEQSILHSPVLEWSMLLALIILGLTSMQHYRKHHHNKNLPFGLFSVGVAICLAGLLIHSEIHHSLTIIGSLVIALGQGLNLTLTRNSEVSKEVVI